MDGYYKDEDETSNTIKDGWLYTGDEGLIDNEGFLKITGRVKDIFKTSRGKYVAPSPIEMKLSENKDLEQICVVGENIPQPIAIAVLSDSGKNRDKESLSISLKETLFGINQKLDKHEQLKKIVVISENWTVENKLLTPTMKIKRNLIEKKYKDFYQAWYDNQEDIVL